MNRRAFIEKTALAAASIGLPTLVPASVFGKNAPSNRITVGFIGTGRQAIDQNLPGMLVVPGVQVTTVCDVDSWRMGEAQKLVNGHYAKQTGQGTYKGCAAVSDFREVINQKGIDALMLSVPDHWHVTMGLMAVKARKPFSIEKPLSLSVQQGRLLADAVKKSGLITRTDSEFRSLRQQNQAVELVRNGRIGKLQKIDITFPSDPDPVGMQPDMPVPKELNYEMWLGPAPWIPYTEKRVHTPFNVKMRPNWMRIDTYAQGMISNWGAHYFDMAQWATNNEHTGPVEVWGRGEFPKALWNTMINFEVTYRYANGVVMTCLQSPTSKPSITYTGSDGWIKVDGYPGEVSASQPAILTSNPQPGEADFSKMPWDKNDFIEGVRQGRPTMIPVEVGHRTISISQIGLIACQVGASSPEQKLRWNPASETFEGSREANARLAVPSVRKEWAV